MGKFVMTLSVSFPNKGKECTPRFNSLVGTRVADKAAMYFESPQRLIRPCHIAAHGQARLSYKKSRRRRRRCNSCHPWAVDLKDTIIIWNLNSQHPRKIISLFFSCSFLYECIGSRCRVLGSGAWMDYRLLVGRRATVEHGYPEHTCMWIEVLGGRMIHTTFV
jgi:hypothetical protein